MSGLREELSDAEYRSLSEQKAQDYRAFVQMIPPLIAVAGAIYAGGLAKSSALAIALSPIPLVVAVWQLVGNTRLQLQLITYLAVFGPSEQGRWERDIAEARPKFWGRHTAPLNRKGLRLSAWTIWLFFSTLTTVIILLFPPMVGLRHGWLVTGIGALVYGAVFSWLYRYAAGIEDLREDWTAIWEEQKGEQSADS
ncbi:MAG: hypothetical protein H0T43_04885 [Solirubrobacterales bacterium]|nr:hypothetical protein [Solirubrobacterales bacterium]